MLTFRKCLTACALLALPVANTLSASADTGLVEVHPLPADTLFTGGTVLTMDDDRSQAEAVAVRKGTIVFVGSNDESQKYLGKDTQVVELDGRTLLPGFIDSHSHMSIAALVYDYIDLRPAPTGPVANIADLKRLLAQQAGRSAKESADENDGWILAYGYDDSQLVEHRHPTKFDLDEISTVQPIVVVHASMHVFVGNSMALQLAGIDASTDDPTGGTFQRVGGSREPNGVIEELAAANRLLSKVPQPSAQQLVENLYKVQQDYARHGVTTAQEGAASLREMDLLEAAAQSDKLLLDTVVLPYWHSIDAVLARGGLTVGRYHNRLKIGGIKIGLDGSSVAKTAYMMEPYALPPAGRASDYRGYLQLTEETVRSQFERIYRDHWQINAHVSGDAAAKLMVDAVQAAQDKYGPRDHRAVMLHANSLKEQEMERMKKLGVVPSFYSYHTCTWGDWHGESLGAKRASELTPAKWAADRGMRFTVHTDAPISPISPMRLVACNVNRQSVSGRVIGKAQRLAVLDALKAVTIHGAYQYYEENQKGTVEVGKLADLAVLSANPLAVRVDKLGDIEVLATYKEGRAVYQSASLVSSNKH